MADSKRELLAFRLNDCKKRIAGSSSGPYTALGEKFMAPSLSQQSVTWTQ